MPHSDATARLAVPKYWTRSIQAALVHVMSLAHYALVQTRSWAANSSHDRARLAAQKDQLDQEIRLLREPRSHAR